MANDGKQQQRTVRDARLGAALRENLKRRKAQARGRDGVDQRAGTLDEAESPGQGPGADESPPQH